MPTNINKPKQRRYIRYPIELAAVLVVDNRLKFDGVILDFCLGGFFLALKSPEQIPLDKAIKVQFSIAAATGGEQYEIDARALHIAGGGIGIAVDDMPRNAFDALKNLAKAPLAALLAASDAKPSKLDQEKLRNLFKVFLIENLPPLLNRYYEMVGSYIADSSQFSECFTNQSMCDDLVTVLKTGRETFISEFCTSVLSQVDDIARNTPERERLIPDYNALSLVEKEDFEDWLNMSLIVRKLANHYDEQINLVASEIGRIFGFNESGVANPLNPAVLCDSFRELVIQLDLSRKINSLVYSAFGKVLFSDLNGLYQKTYLFLSRNQSADKKPARQEQWTDIGKSRGGGGAIAADPRRPGAGGQAPGDGLMPAGAEVRERRPIGQVAATLLDLLTETGIDYPELAVSAAAARPQAAALFDRDEIAAAITKLQENLAGERKLHWDAAALKQRLQETLSGLGLGAKSFAPADLQHLELYGRFFETLFNDVAQASEIKPVLERIHLPLLSLALRGDDFLNADLHPVKNILNQLSVLEPAVKTNRIVKNINIKNAVDNIVARIHNESNPEVFKQAERELEELTRQVTRSVDTNVKRIVETYEGQQKLERARRSVQDEIDKRIAGRVVPKVIPELLQYGWQHLLLIAELNIERKPEEKRAYLKVFDDLLFWLFEQESMLKIQAATIQTTLDYVKEQLTSVCTNVFFLDSVVDELTALLLGSGEPRVRKPMATVRIPPADSASQKELPIKEDAWLAQVEQLSIGDWFSMLRDGQSFEAMKLVWIGDLLQLYVFVNRDGLNKLELSKEELADLMRSGDAIKMESLDSPLVDRTTNLMLQKMHEKLLFNATHDPVTELFTREEFCKQLKNETAKIGEAHHMLCHIEVLDLRVIANICGSTGVEQLLKSLAATLAQHVDSHDLLARLGDESFAILFKNRPAAEGLASARKLVKVVNDAHFQWQENSFSISVSLGLVPFAAESYDVQELLRRADSASMSAERSGPNNVVVFSSEDENLRYQEKLHEWIGRIDKVFAENRLFGRCQMIAATDPLAANHLHYEILLGVTGEDGNVIPPDHFIPAVERCQRMPEIDKWVVNNVFDWIAGNRELFDKMDGFSINLSGQSINSEDFLEFLKSVLAAGNVPCEKITFEITETVAAESLGFTKKFIAAIKQFGCKFSLDDFGSGYSSYSYLKNLNVDYLKIDGAFVKEIHNNKADVAIVKSMNEIAHSMGLRTIAEYVENNEIRSVLKEIGVDFCQGYGIEKPIRLAELSEKLPPSELFSFENVEFWGF
ncbi:DUF1631 family protein [Methylomonas koyamae]|uniref:DUF1631 family protein n=1 Tax=Methylomonas koyamae TaxID=702114 RepID=UPI000BC2CF4A|nr:DUF1631 family protein [Methylomonas koyamae]ATG89611.1 hypothetical protein MKLM6_1356 [Methylomonas koyamae]